MTEPTLSLKNPPPDLPASPVPHDRAVESRGKRLLLTAGPGSGKTRALVNRFLSFIERDRARVRDLLAVTFTERAANEMKRRIVETLLKKGLEQERRDSEGAWVMTIHGFCARLLSEHPVEAGVDPHFRILDEEEAVTLKEVLLEEVLEEEAKTSDAIYEILAAAGEDEFSQKLLAFLDRCHAAGLSCAQAFEITKVPDPAPAARRVSAWAGEIAKLARERGSTEPLRKTALGARALCRRVTRLASQEALTLKDWREVREVRTALEARVVKARELVKQIQKTFDEELEGIFLERSSAHLAAAVERVARRLEDRYAQAKRERSTLDFSDLERKALGLLEGTTPAKRAIREKLEARFKALLVDEFQDTNAVQEKLLAPLAARDAMRVGDRNQSIYFFRGAQPEVFRKLEEELANDAGAEVIPLFENHRSHADLVGFVNGLFSAMAPDGLTVQRLESQRGPWAGQRAAVDLRWCLFEKSEGIERARVREARALASAIRKLVEVEKPIITTSRGETGPVRYEDIAVLFRSFSKSGIFEYELRAADIPYLVLGGRGFYERPEVKDVLSALKVIENPFSDIPLAATLRSPFFHVSDDTLMRLARAAKSKSKHEPLFSGLLKLRYIKGLPKAEREKLAWFLKLYRLFEREKERLPISQLLGRLIRETRYDLKSMAQSDGERRGANLAKLVEIARRFEAQEIFRLGDFIRYVDGLRAREVREREGSSESEGDQVKLMTIHAAKGLEFPVVVLADLGWKPSGAERQIFLVSRTRGVGMRFPDPESGKLADSATYAAIHEEQKNEEAGEQARLLYVAMTRARDILILSGCRPVTAAEATASSRGPDAVLARGHKPRASGWAKPGPLTESLGSWSSLISQAAGLLQSPCDEEREIFGTRARVVQIPGFPEGELPSPMRRLVSDPRVRESLQRAEPITVEGISQESLQLAATRVRALFASFAVPKKFYPEMRELSTTALGAFLDCPRRYAYLYEERIPEERCAEPEDAEPSIDVELDPRVPRNDFGTLVHRVLEALDFKAAAPQALARAGACLAASLPPAARQVTLAKLERFLEHPLAQAIRRARAVYRELPFRLKRPHGIVHGQIDLVFQNPDGTWEVVDYKTTEGGPQVLAQATQRHRFQILIYARACQALLGAQPVAASLAYVMVPEVKRIPLSAELMDEAESQADHVFSSLRGSHFAPQKGPTCDVCSYRAICPAWRT